MRKSTIPTFSFNNWKSWRKVELWNISFRVAHCIKNFTKGNWPPSVIRSLAHWRISHLDWSFVRMNKMKNIGNLILFMQWKLNLFSANIFSVSSQYQSLIPIQSQYLDRSSWELKSYFEFSNWFFTAIFSLQMHPEISTNSRSKYFQNQL